MIVCPTQSIVAGDIDDPTARIARMVARHDVHVRAPEQGTLPKLFYKGADEARSTLRARIADDGMMWADATEIPDHPCTPRRTAASNGRPHRLHDRPPDGMDRQVSAYLVTKAMAAGSSVAAAPVLLGHADDRACVGVLAPMMAGAFARGSPVRS